MIARLGWRLLTETDPRLLGRFLWQFGWQGTRSVQRFRRRMRRGDAFPAFLFLSLTSRCNLDCLGCWATGPGPARDMDPATADAIITAARRRGVSFFGLLGGEPTLYPPLYELIGRHRDAYFQLFTNGTLLTDEVAARLRALGNVTPLISIEGLDRTGDERRGGRGVYGKALAALDACRRARLITGVATSLCKSNLGELATESFLREMAGRGAHYLWYYIYRPSGARPAPELALSADEITAVRRFLVGVRPRAPLLVVDAYWDQNGAALCPAAAGICCHVGPGGDLEPCPPVQFAVDNLQADPGALERFDPSGFLAAFRKTAAGATRGCVLMEQPETLAALVAACAARDSSGRGTARAELAARVPLPGHHQPGREIPERHWFYRLAKRNWFFGFGAYG